LNRFLFVFALNGTTSLLYHVRQLMSQQLPPGGTAGAVFALSEEDVLSCRKRPGIQRLVQTTGLIVSVNPHVAEIGTECRAHLTRYLGVKRLTTSSRRIDFPLDFGRNVALSGGTAG
jgi:hypothetical protein